MRAVAAAAALLFAALSSVLPAAGEEAPAPPPRPSLRPSVLFAQHLYEGDFAEPRGIFYDRSRREVWVADTRNDLIGAFTPDGVPLFAFGEKDRLHEPGRLAVDRRGRILVLDNDRTAVKLFSYRGEFLSTLDLPGLPAAPVLTEISLDAAGFLYVGEGSECRVHVYDTNLKEALRFGACGGGEGEFQSIAGIAADADHIVVVDHQVTPVQVFDRKGNFVRGWGKHDMGIENFSLPEAVALDAHGHVIVIDQLRHEIKFFDLEGNFLDRFGGLGSGPGQVSYPSDVAVDELDRVYVVEKGNGRVQVFTGPGAAGAGSAAGNAR
jgi:tripartite motif-containing protein 71